MDVPAILKRAPQVCLVDGLAYDNPVGSRNAHRWQDVEEVLSAGIAVVASVNLQYIDDQQEALEKITGMRVKQTIPRRLLDMADEIVIVDVSSETASQQDAALREMALLLLADVIEMGLQRYLQSHGLEPLRGTQERFLVWLTPGANTQRMMLIRYPAVLGRHGSRVATPFSMPDLMPTVVALAGLAIPDSVEGENRLRKNARSWVSQIMLPVPITEARRYGFAEYRGLRTDLHSSAIISRTFGGRVGRAVSGIETEAADEARNWRRESMTSRR
jgi:hypothetical protein